MKPYESRDLKDLHPILADAYLKAEAVFNAQNGDVNVIRTCTYRNNAMQQVYFNKRRVNYCQIKMVIGVSFHYRHAVLVIYHAAHITSCKFNRSNSLMVMVNFAPLSAINSMCGIMCPAMGIVIMRR